MVKNISDLMQPALEALAKKQDEGLNILEAHKAFINASLEKEKREKKSKDIENKTPIFSLLPACSDNIRAVPNAFLRGALFGVVEKGSRKYEKNVLKATVNSLSVKFTGEQLDQADLDVWIECLRLNQRIPLGETIYFSSNLFLKEIKRSTGKTNREWLHSCFRRLMSAVVEIGDGCCFYTGQLLQHWERNEKTGQNSIILNQKLLPFFQSQFWTGLSVEHRGKLKGKSLTLWLHSFYSTHSKPYDYKVEKLMFLCGSEVALMWKFRQMLKKSLTDLSKVTGWKCLIDEHDLVQVKKN